MPEGYSMVKGPGFAAGVFRQGCFNQREQRVLSRGAVPFTGLARRLADNPLTLAVFGFTL
jgi:hypothetical protein